MPTLEWIGKDKVVNHHLDVPYRVLERQYSFDENGQHEEDNGSENMIIHGDNLDALKALLPRYEGLVDCIYIDPPYNTAHSTNNNQRWVYSDNVDDERIKAWLGKVVGDEEEDLSRYDKWLCMMYPRLKLLQRLLSDKGVIFISIGDDEQADLKEICDDIFGKNNFIATFVWKSRAKPSNTGSAKVKPQNDAEYVFCYGKSSRSVFQLVLSGNVRSYPHHDEDGDYRLQTILKSNRGESKRDTMTFEIAGYTPPPTKRWQAGEETIRELYARNRITFETGEPMLKYYSHEENAEYSPFYCYIDKKDSSTAENGKKLLNLILGNQHGFDTVKPIEVINYLLKHVVAKDAIILDSFAGSGTTAHSVLQLNDADKGNRKFIIIEMMDYAESLTAERVKRVIQGYGSEEKHIDGIGGNFSYYELGEPLMHGDVLNENVGIDKIREYVYFTDTKSRLPEAHPDEPYYMGTHLSSAYYFYYEREEVTTLNRDFLHTIKTKAEAYVIYADLCTLNDTELEKYHITFKKIPRDITRL